MSTEVRRYAAFTTDPGGGNPAGIVLDAGDLTTAEMQRIAAEVGYSETGFAIPAGKPRHYRVRYFSPLTEVDFCGHVTIATAVLLAESVGQGRLTFHTNAGEVPIDTERSGAHTTATLTSVATHSRPVAEAELDAALTALRWARGDLDPRFPAHVAFAGEDHLVLAASSRERLAKLDYDSQVWAS